jgi:hypothetical protein
VKATTGPSLFDSMKFKPSLRLLFDLMTLMIYHDGFKIAMLVMESGIQGEMMYAYKRTVMLNEACIRIMEIRQLLGAP